MTLLLLLLLAPPNNDPAAAFDAANASYDAGDYAGALAGYRALVDGGYGSAGLFFNMGDAYYRLDSLAQAVRYFEKARLLAPDDARTQHNLRRLRHELGLPGAAPPEPYWTAQWRALGRAVPPLPLLLAGLFLFWMGCGVAARRLWLGRPSPPLRRAMGVLFALAVLLVGLAFALSADVGRAGRAVVLASIPVPAGGAAPGNALRPGQVVRVVEWRGDRATVAPDSLPPIEVSRALLGEI